MELSIMANQITVSSGTGNITVTTSRSVIGTVANVPSANFANFAGNVTEAAQPNITSLGTLGNLTVANTITTEDLVVTGNLSVGNLVANNANYANFAGEANTANVAFSVDGANVSGEVSFAATANAVAGANVSGEVSFAATANAVAGANVSGEVAVANVVSNPTQSNITAVGTLGNLDVSGTITANLIQANTIEGNIALTQVDYIDFDTANGSPGFQTGRVSWDSAKGTLVVDMDGGGNITQQVGEDQYIYVKANATITSGQVVMFNGVQGDTILGAPANTASVGFLPRYVLGLAPANIANGSFGYVQTIGEVYDQKTNAFSAGSILYLQANSAGVLTATPPTAPDPSIVVAACLTQSNNPSATNGRLQVRPDFGYYMDQLHNVSNATPNTGDVLVYNASNVYTPSNTVPIANVAYSVDGANVSGEVAFAATANAVAGANVSGEVAFAATANAVAGGNVSGSVANAVYADTAGFAGGSPPAGSNTQVQFNDQDILGADANFTFIKATPALSVGFSGTGQLLSSQMALNKNVTSNTYLISTVANLNDSGDLTLWKANITDTLSGANTKLIDFIVDGNSQLTLDKGGNHTVAGQSEADSFYTAFANGNITIKPDGSYGGSSYGAVYVDNGYNSPGTLKQAFVTADFANSPFGGTGQAKYITLVEDAGNIAKGGSIEFLNFSLAGSGIGNGGTDPWVPGFNTFRSIPYTANLADSGVGTHTSIQMSSAAAGGGGFLTIIGDQNIDDINRGAWKQFQYRPIAMEFQRRGGNGQVKTGVAAGDITAIDFNFASNGSGNVGDTFASYGGRIAAKVDSSFVGNPFEVTPIGLEFQVAGNGGSYNRYYHSMYANGDVKFNSSGGGTPVTIGFNGVITGNGSGLSNVTASSIENGTSNISFTGSGGDIKFKVDNNNKVEIGPQGLVLTGANTGAANVAQLSIYDGSLNWILDNTDFGGGTPFGVTRFNSAFLDPFNYLTQRGNVNSPADTQSGDTVFSEKMQVRNSGAPVGIVNRDVQIRSISGTDVAASYLITATNDTANSLFKVDFGESQVTGSLTANSFITSNANVTGANVIATQFVVLANDTASNLTTNTPAVVGVAGAMIAVSDQDYQPASWSVTDNVWKYVSNRANV